MGEHAVLTPHGPPPPSQLLAAQGVHAEQDDATPTSWWPPIILPHNSKYMKWWVGAGATCAVPRAMPRAAPLCGLRTGSSSSRCKGQAAAHSRVHGACRASRPRAWAARTPRCTLPQHVHGTQQQQHSSSTASLACVACGARRWYFTMGIALLTAILDPIKLAFVDSSGL